MSHVENAVRIAARLYDTRDTMRRFYGDKYPQEGEFYKRHIKIRMGACEEDALTASMALIKKLQTNVEGSGMAQALLMSAYVEISEEKP